MSVQACAEIVKRGDPDRFLSAMSGPASARAVLFPIYAFNVEVARAPWVTEEPMIAEMRLQWWRDALEEIAAGGAVRRHEVATPLADILDPAGVAVLDALIQARRWDVYKDTFENADHFQEYLDQTAGGLMWVAARALGADTGEQAVRRIGQASGLANLFRAVPELERSGRKPLVDGRETAIAALADAALNNMSRAHADVPAVARPATRAAWQSSVILRQAKQIPARVADGALGTSELRKRAGLLWRTVLNRA